VKRWKESGMQTGDRKLCGSRKFAWPGTALLSFLDSPVPFLRRFNKSP